MPIISLEASVTTELYTGIMLNASIKSTHGTNNKPVLAYELKKQVNENIFNLAPFKSTQNN